LYIITKLLIGVPTIKEAHFTLKWPEIGFSLISLINREMLILFEGSMHRDIAMGLRFEASYGVSITKYSLFYNLSFSHPQSNIIEPNLSIILIM
jgi:hypothetical protein